MLLEWAVYGEPSAWYFMKFEIAVDRLWDSQINKITKTGSVIKSAMVDHKIAVAGRSASSPEFLVIMAVIKPTGIADSTTITRDKDASGKLMNPMTATITIGVRINRIVVSQAISCHCLHMEKRIFPN